ncbi:TMV resistance protein N-like protein, partial [Tanacetum coccineum]
LYKEVNYWVDQSDAQILAIWGMGGSGKTTLARHILYSNYENFKGISMLEDIGHKSTEQLHDLQEKLLIDISKGKRRKIPSVAQGTCTIEKVLQTKKALILLDNIVESSHVFDLLGTGIKTQSKIIITTRKRNPREWFKFKSWTCREFEMKPLDNDVSLELLSLHAFGSKSPMEGYQKLVEKALRYCDGNPLALKVLGSALSDDRTIEFWDSLLKSLEREAHDAIQSVLITSYNSLPQDINKELFLHIACFFVGKDMDFVVNLLEPDYSAISGIKTLSKRCLLFVSPTKKLVMHRLLQEMARK